MHEQRPADTGRAASSGLLPLWAFEAGLLAIGVGIYKGYGLPGSNVAAKAGLMIIAGSMISVIALRSLIAQWRTCGARVCLLGLVTNLLALALLVVGSEAVLRATAVRTSGGTRVASIELATTWQELRERNRAIIGRASGDAGEWNTYHVPDPLLGWTVGSNRHAGDGLYYSSVEGIRSGASDVSFAGRRPRWRIAIVGDSYSFGDEGPYEDSYGFQLERLLGPDVQVLNFAVNGYGIDQAFLRYRRDVPSWRPDIVLFGFVGHDIFRTLAVYPSVSFDWPYPFAKPRFISQPSGLRLLNTPVPAPENLLAFTKMSQLPYVFYDYGYQRHDWPGRDEEPWMIWRLWTTLVPRWTTPRPDGTEAAAVSLSARILDEFGRIATAAGATPVVLYLPSPSAGDLDVPGYRNHSTPRPTELAAQILATVTSPQLNLTDCMQTVPPADRVVAAELHYTAPANLAAAKCVAKFLIDRTPRLSLTPDKSASVASRS